MSRALLSDVHKAFGGELRAFFVGGAFTEPETLQFFYDLGIHVGEWLWLHGSLHRDYCERFPAVSRRTQLGKPLPGMELRILSAGADGIGEVAVRSETSCRVILTIRR